MDYMTTGAVILASIGLGSSVTMFCTNGFLRGTIHTVLYAVLAFCVWSFVGLFH